VGNAIKFTPKGRVSLEVMRGKESNQLHFMVVDTGVGISEEHLKHIFNAFSQADTSTTRKFGGTGLGTSISQDLVELMGGETWAESKEGDGSTFHFTVTLPYVEQPKQVSSPADVPDKSSLPVSRRGFQILLVEDVDVNADLAKIRLEQRGHYVTIAWNGREAVEAVKQVKNDIILMDIQMPEMDDIIAKPIEFKKLFKAMEDLVPKGVGEIIVQEKGKPLILSGATLSPMEGIDIVKGLKTWKNQEAYIDSLLEFADNYGNVADDLTLVVREGDMEEAYHVIHRLKGVAGNLSIINVADSAAHIERMFKENRMNDSMDEILKLSAAVNKAVTSINNLEKVRKTPEKKINLPYLEKLFNKMLVAFDQFSTYAAESVLSELEGYLSHEQLDSIVRYIEQFEFEGARYETIKLGKTLGIYYEKQQQR